ncbi:hypothetical protein Mpsy_0822 [Methanolobus psychrophilus R15]|nr:hypothetical protein Mpsy_0822 [Methanolobus psychrophilus R15]
MLKQKSVLMLGIIVLGLIVSGCTDNKFQGDAALSDDVSGADLSEADALLRDEQIGITDPEIMQLEAEMAELEALIEGMDTGENISVEEI